METKLNKNYMVVAESGLLSTILIFDKVRMCIVKLEHGIFTDITEDCFKLTKRKNKVCGGLWYQFLQNEIDNTSACYGKIKYCFIQIMKMKLICFYLKQE